MIVPLFVGREKSVRALATQKNASDDDPASDAIFAAGTLATNTNGRTRGSKKARSIVRASHLPNAGQ